MDSIAWYKEWSSSPFYDKLYFERNEAEIAAFLRRLLEKLAPAAGSRMVDIACGTGRNSRLLASLGFEVTGIDLSPENIAIAQQTETGNPEFFLHDMRLPFWGNYFNYAFSLFTSFGYYRTRREHDDAIRTVAKSLQPGGIFIIDYINVHYAEQHHMGQQVIQAGSTNYDIHHRDDGTHFYKKIMVTDPSLPVPLAYTEQLTKFSLGDFTDMLSFQGLQVQEVFGDYQLNKYDTRKTERMIIVGKRTNLD